MEVGWFATNIGQALVWTIGGMFMQMLSNEFILGGGGDIVRLTDMKLWEGGGGKKI